MTAFIVIDNIITNSIVIDDDFIYLPTDTVRTYIEGKWIGDKYEDIPTPAQNQLRADVDYLSAVTGVVL